MESNKGTAPAGRQRLDYIDILRGVTMLLVVYSHIDIHLLGNAAHTTVLNSIFVTFRMPLFFFISGFFIYSSRYDASLLRRRTANRIVRQLYPTLLFFLLYVAVCQPWSLRYYLHDPHKAGYWFTFVAVQAFLLTAPALWMLSAVRVRTVTRTLALAALIAAAVAARIAAESVPGFNSSSGARLASLPLLLSYLPYVYLGCLARLHWEWLQRRVLCPAGLVLSAAVFALCVALPGVDVLKALMPPAGVMVLLCGASMLPRRVCSGAFGKALSSIGTSTLEIYLMHYFLIRLLARLDILTSLLRPLRDTAFEAPAFLLVSAAVAVACIGITRLLKSVRVYGLLFPGTMPPLRGFRFSRAVQ